MLCKRCFRIVGEFYRCSQHGGPDAFVDAAYRFPPRQTEPYEDSVWDNLQDKAWDFLDAGGKVLRRGDSLMAGWFAYAIKAPQGWNLDFSR